MDGIDLVVFDVDGVLVDPRQSYDAAARRTVEHFLGPRSGGWLTDAEMAALRAVGGFNDEWDIAAAAVWAQRAARRDLTRLAPQGAGGLAALAQAAGLTEDPPRDAVLSVFCEIYAGTARVEEMYGRPPVLEAPQEGLWQQERRRLEAAELLLLPVRKAIYTGRTTGELRPTFERFAFGIHFPEHLRLTADGPYRKPDGRGLLYLAQAASASHVLMVGDNVDDALTAQRARSLDPSRRYDFCGVLGGGLGERAEEVFTRLGVEAIAPSTSELLRWLRGA